MANPYKLTLNKPGVANLLNSAEFQAACFEQAQQLAEECGEAYYAKEDAASGDRTGATVKSDSRAEYYRNLRSNYVLKKTGLHEYDGKRKGRRKK